MRRTAWSMFAASVAHIPPARGYHPSMSRGSRLRRTAKNMLNAVWSTSATNCACTSPARSKRCGVCWPTAGRLHALNIEARYWTAQRLTSEQIARWSVVGSFRRGVPAENSLHTAVITVLSRKTLSTLCKPIGARLFRGTHRPLRLGTVRLILRPNALFEQFGVSSGTFVLFASLRLRGRLALSSQHFALVSPPLPAFCLLASSLDLDDQPAVVVNLFLCG